MTRVHHLKTDKLDVTTIASGPPWNQNCYLVADRASGAFMIIDPGFDSQELRASIEARGDAPQHLVATHGHPDHLGAAAALSDWLGIDCRISADDRVIARHAPLYAAAFAGLRIELPRRMGSLDPKERLRLGTVDVDVLAVPGHTPGSLAFNFGDIVLTGDTLFRRHRGRTDFPRSDPRALTASIGHLLSGLPADVQLLAGHGQPWTAGEAQDWWAAAGPETAGAAAS